MRLATLTVLMTLLSAVGIGAHAASCLPIPKTTPTSCNNDFDVAFPIGNETSLISSVESGLLSTSIKYRFTTGAVDALVQVNWLDENGATLFSGSNRRALDASGRGPADTYTWGETRYGAFAATAAQIKQGTADFAGSISINNPCVSPCNTGHHKFLPSPFKTGGGTEPATTAGISVATAAPLAQISGEFTVYDFDPTAPGDIDQAVATQLLDFTSAVEWTGADYQYLYSITNHSALSYDVGWKAALLEGPLDGGGTLSRSFSSPLEPNVATTLAELTLGSFAFSGGVGMLQPVPAPAPVALLGSALACLAARRRRERPRLD